MEESVQIALDHLFAKISHTLAQPQAPFVDAEKASAPEAAPAEVPAEIPAAIGEPKIEIAPAAFAPVIVEEPAVEPAAEPVPAPVLAPILGHEILPAQLELEITSDFLRSLERISPAQEMPAAQPAAEPLPLPRKKKEKQKQKQKTGSFIGYVASTLAYAAAIIVAGFITSELRNELLPAKPSLTEFSSKISQTELTNLKRENVELRRALEGKNAEIAALKAGAKSQSLAQKAPREIIRVITKEVPKEEIASPITQVCERIGNDPFHLYVSYLHRETLNGNICSNIKQVTYLKRFIKTHSVSTNELCISAWQQIEKASGRCGKSAAKETALSKVGG